MKVKLKGISLLILIAIVLVFQSCSNDDGVVLESDDQLEGIQSRIEQYQESIESIQAPESMEQFAQENTYASNAIVSLTSLQIQALVYSSVFLTIPNDAEQQGFIGKSNNNTNVWTWSYNGVTLYYTVTSDATFDYFEYDIEQEGVRKTFYEGKISKDGSFYEVKFYGEGGAFFLMTYTKTGNNIKFKIEDQNQNKIELSFNEVDQSGSIKSYESGILTESFVWSADGTGQYVNHSTGETFTWP